MSGELFRQHWIHQRNQTLTLCAFSRVGRTDKGFRIGQSVGMAIKESCIVKASFGVFGGV